LKPILLNLAADRQPGTRVSPVLLLGLALLVGFFTYYTMKAIYENRRTIAEYERKIAAIDRGKRIRVKIPENRLPKVSKERAVEVENEVGFINAAIFGKLFPWDLLLDDLERSVPEGVVLLKFAAEENTRKVQIQGEARAMEKITRFLENLENSRHYSETALRSLNTASMDASEYRGEGPGEVLRFELECTAAGAEPLG